MLRPHAVTRFNGVDYSYDNNGNMKQAGGQYLWYDAENRLVKVSSDSAGLQYIARFAYG